MTSDLVVTLTMTAVLVGLVVLTAVLVALAGAVVRLVRGAGLVVRNATPGRSAGWTVEAFVIGYQSTDGPWWREVRLTWPEAASWAASTSRRPDVQTAFVDVPSNSAGATSWLWQHGIQTSRQEVSYV
jgi:hypothetical protein